MNLHTAPKEARQSASPKVLYKCLDAGFHPPLARCILFHSSRVDRAN